MNVYLIGVGRTGKSSIIKELEKRGYNVVKEYVPKTLKKLKEKYGLKNENVLEELIEKKYFIEMQTNFLIEALKQFKYNNNSITFYDRSLLDVLIYMKFYSNQSKDLEVLYKFFEPIVFKIHKSKWMNQKFIFVSLNKDIYEKSFGEWYRNDKKANYYNDLKKENEFFEFLRKNEFDVYFLREKELNKRVDEILNFLNK
jgi:predicted ATPase